MSHRILVVDDEENIRWVIGTSLEKAGYRVDYGIDGDDALKKIPEGDYSLVLLDINMPGKSGFDVLEFLADMEIGIPVILITAQNTVNNAIHGIKLGAYDYVAKPFNLDDIREMVQQAISSYKESNRIADSSSPAKQVNLDEIVGKSHEMLKVYKTVGRIADKDVTVLITGESGTGKELITKAIHHNSRRKDRKLVSVNIAAIPKELIESELFGHEKGAFTGAQTRKTGRFEEADGGTLHIDEIGEMPVDLQTKLLRVIEEKKFYRLGGEEPIRVDVRIIASTNRELIDEVENGRFREDLYYRLNAINIELPPLRNRKEDIPVLIDHFIARYSDELSVDRKELSEEVSEKFKRYRWPGNVRELENTVKRMMVLIPDRIVEPKHLTDISPQLLEKRHDPADGKIEKEIREYAARLVSSAEEGTSPGLYARIISKVEKQLFQAVLDFTNGNKKRAASILGINRNTLSKKLSELEINTD